MSRQCSPYDNIRGISGLSCPIAGQPAHYTECCLIPHSEEKYYCCPPASFLQQMDSTIVMIVALVVMGMCVLAIILILICCFSSRCPLYNACRVNYTQADIIAYNKEQDPLTSCMPGDGEGFEYSTNAIKIKPVADI